jgi:hypothetical protein
VLPGESVTRRGINNPRPAARFSVQQTLPFRYRASAYDRQWALTLFDRGLNQFGKEPEQSGKTAEFGILSPFLTAERGAIPHETVATQLGLSETGAHQAVHRLGKRFRDVFRDEIAHTVAAPEDVAEEIRHLLAALAG